MADTNIDDDDGGDNDDVDGDDDDGGGDSAAVTDTLLSSSSDSNVTAIEVIGDDDCGKSWDLFSPEIIIITSLISRVPS